MTAIWLALLCQFCGRYQGAEEIDVQWSAQWSTDSISLFMYPAGSVVTRDEGTIDLGIVAE